MLQPGDRVPDVTVFDNDVHANAFSFGHGLSNIPVSIFVASEQADQASFARAWGAAFVLLAFIFITNMAARTLLGRSRRRLAG